MGGQGPPRIRVSRGSPRGADAFAFLPRSTGGAPLALAGEAFTAKEANRATGRSGEDRPPRSKRRDAKRRGISGAEGEGRSGRVAREESTRRRCLDPGPCHAELRGELGRERRRGDVVIGTVTRETGRATDRSRCRPPGAAYWLITKTANGRVAATATPR
jgi:hypothetical protein